VNARTREPVNEDIARLLITCPDRPGVVATVSHFLFDHGANIIHSNQHSTEHGEGVFFMRTEFRFPDLASRGQALEQDFKGIAGRFGMQWRLSYAARRKRLGVFVSRAEHALLELIWQQRAGDLAADIVVVISNHTNNEELVKRQGIPFFHVPITADGKPAAEAHELEILAEHAVDVVVLARYMQVLSPDFLSHYPARIINIHHGFLPAFVGANPYQAAYERGVKLIGATAHYVTEDLDAGPIIEQDTQRIDHRHDTEDLRRLGRYIERVVLARAVGWHVEDRVLLHGNKTIIFN
jgi:formyltetrahydrofolate deformylase